MNKLRILVYTYKGGVGKTKISLCLAKELDYYLVTNDPYDDFSTAMKKGTVKILPPLNEQSNIDPTLLNLSEVIYDFGGSIDARLNNIAPLVDWIIMPFKVEQHSMKVWFGSFNDMAEKWRSKIVLIANDLQKNDWSIAQQVVNQGIGNIPLFPLRQSTLFKRVYQETASPSQIFKNKKGYSHRFGPVIDEIQNIIKFLTKGKNG